MLPNLQADSVICAYQVIREICALQCVQGNSYAVYVAYECIHQIAASRDTIRSQVSPVFHIDHTLTTAACRSVVIPDLAPVLRQRDEFRKHIGVGAGRYDAR